MDSVSFPAFEDTGGYNFPEGKNFIEEEDTIDGSFIEKNSPPAGVVIEANNSDETAISPCEQRIKRDKDHASFYYKMDHKRRGKFYIFSHSSYDDDLGLKPRGASKCDSKNLKRTMLALDFEVTIFKNLTKSEIMDKIRDYTREDHSDEDCFGCAISTHGALRSDIEYIYAYDTCYKVEEITDELKNCKTLHDKPKLFFIQACRGSKSMDGRNKRCDSCDADPSQENLLPVYADIFIAYSTVSGFYAWKRENEGSWFISALCFSFEWFGRNLELMHIMTRTSNMLAHDWQSSSTKHPGYDKKKQICSVVTQLIAEVHFNHRKCANEATANDRVEMISRPTQLDVFTEADVRDGSPSNASDEEYRELKMKILLQKEKLQQLKMELLKKKIEKM